MTFRIFAALGEVMAETSTYVIVRVTERRDRSETYPFRRPQAAESTKARPLLIAEGSDPPDIPDRQHVPTGAAVLSVDFSLPRL
jgi:hypothetical protein